MAEHSGPLDLGLKLAYRWCPEGLATCSLSHLSSFSALGNYTFLIINQNTGINPQALVALISGFFPCTSLLILSFPKEFSPAKRFWLPSLSRQRCFLGFRNLFFFSSWFNKSVNLQIDFRARFQSIFILRGLLLGACNESWEERFAWMHSHGTHSDCFFRMNLFMGLGVQHDF